MYALFKKKKGCSDLLLIGNWIRVFWKFGRSCIHINDNYSKDPSVSKKEEKRSNQPVSDGYMGVMWFCVRSANTLKFS